MRTSFLRRVDRFPSNCDVDRRDKSKILSFPQVDVSIEKMIKYILYAKLVRKEAAKRCLSSADFQSGITEHLILRGRGMVRRELGNYISILHRHKQRYINQQMKKDGLGYAGYNFLLYIEKHEGCSQKDICRHLAIDEALATRKVNQMVAGQYLRRQREGRGYALYLDEHGRDILPTLDRLLDRWWVHVLGDMPETEVESFRRQLEQMADRAMEMTTGDEENT